MAPAESTVVTGLRPANDDDGWEVIALIGACWSEYPGCVMDVHGECPDLLRPASAYQRQGGAFWVVTDPCGTVVATVGWRPLDAGIIELERLYVHRRWRRRGLAAMLADLVERTAFERDASRIELWTDTRFTDAHHFYERRGYVRHGPDRELGYLSRTREHHYAKAVRSPEDDPPGPQ
jgi:GNAT superfamily N-acetyltransferase